MADQLRVVVLGAGPGGYPAAFLAAERGMDVTLIDTRAAPGGVCLYEGCIPSKALLHAASVVTEAREAEGIGLVFGSPALDLDRLRTWKDGVVRGLTGGLSQIARARKVRYVQGHGRFVDAHTVRVANDGELTEVQFDAAIVATGSSPSVPAPLRLDSARVWGAREALALPEVPKLLLVVGGGYIGLEMATVYAALGSRVTVVEATGGLLQGADRDLVEVLAKRIAATVNEVRLHTTVQSLAETEDGGVQASLAGPSGAEDVRFDRILIATGRRPNSADLGLEMTRALVSTRGFIEVDPQRRTAELSIFAIGDVAGEPMLAHKATHEARVAVEALGGEPSAWEPPVVPAVIYTDPEIAWCGLTETEARSRSLDVDVARFPWSASGRAATAADREGLTKWLVEAGSGRLLGAGIVGRGAGELIGEATLAIEMGARLEDIRRTVHAHPSRSETLMEAAEAFFGTSPHFLARRR
ncbi:MAG: dihydrolipoyl dehydrogenase [Dehalococcoidia bacterium]|nr:MAG: dihydrolipoyl dehydrogenase [Dehalococcoidia bacterium]